MCTNLWINSTTAESQREDQKVARRILTKIAQAAARKKKSKLKEFFNRKMKSIGHTKAIIALAKKITTIIWPLIANDEMTKMNQGIKRDKFNRGKLLKLRSFRLMNVYK